MKYIYLKKFFVLAIVIFFVENFSFAKPPLIGILINDGAKYSNSRDVVVKIKSLKNAANLMDAMQIGVSENLSDAEWQPYSENSINLQLTHGDGEKIVFVRLKDKAGNISPIEKGRIILDTTPPQEAELFINKGEKFTNDNTGRVQLQCKGEDAAFWQISNTNNFNDVWETISQNKPWTIELRSGDGEKTVYARFKDAAGNISDVQSKIITLDTKPPANEEILINTGEKYIKNPNVKLKVKADGANIVRIVDRNGGNNYDFEPEKDGFMTIDWKFDTLQGKKIVKAYFMDAAQNKTNNGVEASIIYDTHGPATPKLMINEGSKYSNDPNGLVSLQIYPREKESNLTMSISNSESFKNASEQNFTATVEDWKIDNQEDGLKYVYLRLIDEAGNYSEIVSASISLDRKPPVINGFVLNEGIEFVINPRVNIQIDAEDAVMMQISNNPNFPSTSEWEKFNPLKIDWRIIPGDGEKIVYGRFRDEAGNISEIYSDKIILDTRPPLAKAMIENGKKYCNDPDGRVTLQLAFEGDDAMGMQVSNTSDFTDVKLIPVETEIPNWKLEGEDGLKTVYFRIKDKAGNFSNIFTSKIILDRNPPENYSIAINNGDEWLTNPSKKVALSLTATEAYKMKIGNEPDLSGEQWIPYKTATSWTLIGEEGEHTIYAVFADEVGNETPVIQASIRSDFSPPKVNGFSVNNDEKFTNDPQKSVTLTIDVEDATTMAIANNPISESTNWEPVVKEKEWILSNEDGPKTVYARFRDEAGNVTAEQHGRIILDRVPPVECEIAINKNAEWMTAKDGKVTLFLKASGATEMKVSNTPYFSSKEWETYSAIKDSWQINTKSSNAMVYAKFRDEAGNESEVVSTSINVDVLPPQNPKIVINKGEKYLTGDDKKLTIAISVEGAKFMRIGFENSFRGVEWEPVAGFKELVMPEGDGEKEIYTQFKDQAENLSEIVSSNIIVDTNPPKLKTFLIDNGAEWTNNKDKKVTLTIDAEDAFEMRVDHDPAFTNSKWQKFSNKVEDFTLSGDDGEKTVFILLKDEAGNVTNQNSAKINLKRSF